MENSKKRGGVRRKFERERKLENVLPAPENKNREKRVWAIARNYLHSITFKALPLVFLSRRQAKKRTPKRPSDQLVPNLYGLQYITSSKTTTKPNTATTLNARSSHLFSENIIFPPSFPTI